MPVDVAAFNPPGSWRVITIPGRTVADPKIDRDVGTDSSVSLSSRAPSFAFSMSMTGDAPLTVTVSCSVASFKDTSTVIVLRTGTTTPSRTCGENDASSNVSLYVPELTAGNRYCPF